MLMENVLNASVNIQQHREHREVFSSIETQFSFQKLPRALIQICRLARKRKNGLTSSSDSDGQAVVQGIWRGQMPEIRTSLSQCRRTRRLSSRLPRT